MRNDRPAAHVLSIHELSAGYDGHDIIHGIGFSVVPGEVIALIGHNGAGKSTVLKAIAGVIRPTTGRISLDDNIITTASVRARALMGVRFLPQGNAVFRGLSVRENLDIGRALLGYPRVSLTDLARLRQVVPQLDGMLSRRAEDLSGGERQIVAIGRTLLDRPRLLLVDEPSLGLASGFVDGVLKQFAAVAEASGAGVIIVEQKVRAVLSVAHTVGVIRGGRLVHWGDARALRNDTDLLRTVYL